MNAYLLNTACISFKMHSLNETEIYNVVVITVAIFSLTKRFRKIMYL